MKHKILVWKVWKAESRVCSQKATKKKKGKKKSKEKMKILQASTVEKGCTGEGEEERKNIRTQTHAHTYMRAHTTNRTQYLSVLTPKQLRRVCEGVRSLPGEKL